uniref:G_PROTEIN_RECEP_F3_4 domain-containing protein n=1 Tax=Macrostomum lignano TaxID=282301 RepID=A0A1I8F352_9PLAT
MPRCPDVKMSRCQRCHDVKMSGCQDVTMSRCHDVRDVTMSEMSRCQRCHDVKIYRDISDCRDISKRVLQRVGRTISDKRRDLRGLPQPVRQLDRKPQQYGLNGFDTRFDAVTAAALAINATLEQGENYTAEPADLDCSSFKEKIFENVRSLDFHGLSPSLRDPISASPTPSAGGSAPVDSPRILSKLVHASLVSAVVSGGLSACGACLTLAAMAVNLWFRKVPYIRLSSPIVNTIIGLGCLLCHASCLIMTFNAYMGSQLGLCWSSCSASSLATHHQGLAPLHGDCRYSADGCWTAVGSRTPGFPSLADMISDGAVVLHKLVVCQSSSEVLWKGLIIGMKAVFLLFGIFFAWETRTIHVEALNDSKVIGICVYNTTVMGLIGVVLEFALPIGSVDLRLVLLTCCINICSATTVLLVFGRKVVVRVLTILKDRRVRVADANTVLRTVCNNDPNGTGRVNTARNESLEIRQLPADNCQSTNCQRLPATTAADNCQPTNCQHCQPTTASRQLPADNCQPTIASRQLPADKF